MDSLYPSTTSKTPRSMFTNSTSWLNILSVYVLIFIYILWMKEFVKLSRLKVPSKFRYSFNKYRPIVPLQSTEWKTPSEFMVEPHVLRSLSSINRGHRTVKLKISSKWVTPWPLSCHSSYFHFETEVPRRSDTISFMSHDLSLSTPPMRSVPGLTPVPDSLRLSWTFREHDPPRTKYLFFPFFHSSPRPGSTENFPKCLCNSPILK